LCHCLVTVFDKDLKSVNSNLSNFYEMIRMRVMVLQELLEAEFGSLLSISQSHINRVLNELSTTDDRSVSLSLLHHSGILTESNKYVSKFKHLYAVSKSYKMPALCWAIRTGVESSKDFTKKLTKLLKTTLVAKIHCNLIIALVPNRCLFY